MHLAEESLEEKQLLIKHTKAKGMYADGALNPLEGEEFNKYRRVEQGISHTTG
jgi:hypothetical protein